jgi:ABC-type bacteriocin/lantibiotic exporter with double-glycine peptidase domain
LDELGNARKLKAQQNLAIMHAESQIPGAAIYGEFSPHITCRNLEIRYSDAVAPTLRDVSIEIPAGSFTAIVGPSGAGKTTLVDALLGIAVPTTGFVSISGVSPNMAMSKWKNKIKYVPQEVQLIAGSVKENICWPENVKEFPDSQVLDVLNMVELIDWFKSQNGGLETRIGLGGSNLSGGQKQRLGIARALLSNPEVLILDESTSALDTETESIIADRILKNMSGLTRIVIAHRLSTVFHADNLVYLENGVKVAEGTFTELRKLVPQFDKNAIANGA